MKDSPENKTITPLKQDIRDRQKRKQSAAPNNRYPLRRGLVGTLAYWFGMTYTRLHLQLTAEGLENIPSQTPYIIAANHETYVDGMWIGSFLPRQHFRLMSAIAAKDLEERHGLFGKIIVRVGRAIPIDRFGNPLRGLVLAVKKLQEGNILLIHPEGTRSNNGRLGTFKEGAAYIAMKGQVPVLPVFIDGGYEVFNRHMKAPQPYDTKTGRRRKVILTFGQPLSPKDFDNKEELNRSLVDWMQQQFKNKKIPRLFSKKRSKEISEPPGN